MPESDTAEALRTQGLLPRHLASAVDVLRRHEMPPEEIHAVVTTDDPTLVRRHLELHRERLDEWLAEQARRLSAVEFLLTEAASQRRQGRLDTGSARPTTAQSITDPSSVSVHPGLCATSHGCPSGSTKTPE